MSHHQNARKNDNIKRAVRFFANVAMFSYLIMTTNQNCVHEERNGILNACYQCVQNSLSPRLLFKSSMIKTDKTAILFCLHSAWVWNLVFHIKEGNESKDVWGQSVQGDEVTGGCKTFLNEEHQTFRMRWPGHVTRIGVSEDFYRKNLRKKYC